VKRILDPDFRYRPSFDTDLRATFERIRREQQAREREANVQQDTKIKLVRLGRHQERG
jgi:hypothetical protein